MRIDKKIGSALIAMALSVSLALPSVVSTIRAAQKQDFLVSWFPLGDFTTEAVIKATDYNMANTTATLSLISDGKNVDIKHVTATTKTHHGYTSDKNGWHVADKWWRLSQLTTSGYRDITISFAMKSSDTGPRDFLLQYSFDGETWLDAGQDDEPVKLTMTNAFKYYGPFLLPEELDDYPNFFLRIYKEDNISVKGDAVSSLGTNSITEIVLQGIPIMDDGRTVLSEWYISQAVAESNHKYYAGKDFSLEKPHFMATGGLFAATTAFWVTKISTTTHLPQAINTSNTNAWFEGGVRYQGLEKDAYWVMELASAGYKNLRIDWEMRCTPFAPADYHLQYSLNYDPTNGEFGDWLDIDKPLLIIGDLPFGTPNSRFTYYLPEAVENQEKFHLRLWVASNRAVNGAVEGVDKINAAFHVNNIYITATKMKVVEKEKLTTVVANPASASLKVDDLVELSHLSEDVTIYYQINDGEILPYNIALSFDESWFIGDPAKVTVKTWAEKAGYLSSDVVVYEYELKLKEKQPEQNPQELPTLPEITVKLSSSWVTAGTKIELSSPLDGVKIFYTINEETENEYSGTAITIEDSMFVTASNKLQLSVRGELAGYQASQPVVYTFQRYSINTVNTGDPDNWLLWGLMSLGGIVAVAQYYRIKKKPRKEQDKL